MNEEEVFIAGWLAGAEWFEGSWLEATSTANAKTSYAEWRARREVEELAAQRDDSLRRLSDGHLTNAELRARLGAVEALAEEPVVWPYVWQLHEWWKWHDRLRAALANPSAAQGEAP